IVRRRAVLLFRPQLLAVVVVAVDALRAADIGVLLRLSNGNEEEKIENQERDPERGGSEAPFDSPLQILHCRIHRANAASDCAGTSGTAAGLRRRRRYGSRCCRRAAPAAARSRRPPPTTPDRSAPRRRR